MEFELTSTEHSFDERRRPDQSTKHSFDKQRAPRESNEPSSDELRRSRETAAILKLLDRQNALGHDRSRMNSTIIFKARYLFFSTLHIINLIHIDHS